MQEDSEIKMADQRQQYLRFRAGVLEEMDLAEVVSHSHHPLIMGATKCVDVCAI